MTLKYKKINEVEAVIWLVFLLGLYILNDLLDGLLIGVIIVPLINWIMTGGTWYFFWQKGDKTASKPLSLIIQAVGDAIPFIPAPVIAFAVKAYIHNHPEATGAIITKIAK
jgi:hypothetical protein